jgi:DNA polymerase-3 subunit alpha (Gram-positive type)
LSWIIGVITLTKTFKEVFPSLQLDTDLAHGLSDAEVTRISTNHKRDAIRVYLQIHTLLPKRRIWKLEQEIKRQCFPKEVLRVYVIEHFVLSGLYTPEKLYEAYKDSIFEEIDAYSSLLLNIFKKARFRFTEGHMDVDLEDTVIAHEYEQQIHDILHKIFCERCGQQLIIDFTYRKPKASKYRANAQKEIDSRIAEITRENRLLMQQKKADDPNGEEMEAPSAVTSQGDGTKAAAFSDKGGTGGGNGGSGTRRNRPIRRSDHPDVIYGREFDEDTIPLEEVQGEIGEVVIRGKIINVETREIRNERTILTFVVTDFSDTIGGKLFLGNDQVDEICQGIKPGAFIKVKASPLLDKFDHELTLSSIYGIMRIPDFTTTRMDHAPEKRVELHCHTKMSDMDGVSDVEDIIRRAASWGHSAIAITDHGAVQAFPSAAHAIPKDSDLKVIYGCEIYLVDDTKGIVTDPRGQSLDGSFVVFDLETTGFNAEKNKIIEIGAVKVEGGRITERFSEFVNPKEPIPFHITELTSIRDEDVIDAPDITEILPRFMDFCRGTVMVAHNADFDMAFLKANCQALGYDCDHTYVDTVALARFLLPTLSRYKLDNVAKAVGVPLEHHHRAVDDAECTAQIFEKFVKMLKDRGFCDLDQVNESGMASEETIRKMPSYHCILLAKNDIGRINLYRLVSMSHLQYFYRRPKIPKSQLIRYREGLLVGSACEAGELYRAILNSRPEEEISRIVAFYDYLEIQPLGNNMFMTRKDDGIVKTPEDLRNINRRILALGDSFKKPVVATCDVHFLDPSDEIYRRIIMAGKGFSDADDQAPLYLRTTEEMLEEFSYLGSERAEEVVITNTNRIADMCEPISPVRPDKCPPVIENSDEMLRKICYDKAHAIYGEDLPPIVEERLSRELNSIIGNGYAVMYIIAQKLVWKSNEDGYLVGSRGSVGSSFAATMAGITEVNPLSPHYICEYCHFVDFDSEEVKAFSGRAGCDMPDRKCPVCGKDLKKEGFDIPFETFLGFKGNKEPDIDLNFSGDYQSKAHKYTEVIFGEGQTFKAGTIGTLADKTAFGYIKNYYEERGVHKRNCEIDRIVQGCVGVRRTTGQHPGGIIVLPMGEEINSFTPVQHPANDMDSDIITTHFDYHSIDSNLLKLDILGHDDPTMIRMLEDLTGLKAQEIPLDDKTVMSLFKNTEALGVTSKDLGGVDMGTLGIPEFGTDFAMGMLRDAKPQEFTDLIRISGLSHGTDVWLGNAQTLIEEGTATISTCICTRDDIMTYLIHMGLDSAEAFDIMEKTRKGIIAKGKCDQWPQWKQDMIDHGVPEWYTESCEKIKYMFPKAHAAAYVMMAWRIAYCKVFYPLAYYAAFFSIRATAFSYELMCQGKEKLEFYMAEIKKQDKISKKDEDTLRDARIVQEMYARGYEFLPMDLYRSDARYFQIVDGKLLPPFNAIDGMGDKAAESLAIAAAQGKFLSKQDLRERGKISKSIVDLMSDLGIISDLSETNQLSLFDFTA